MIRDMERIEDLIYDWNTHGGDAKPAGRLEFDEETLRDGLQSPAANDPTIERCERRARRLESCDHLRP